jgi:hypothetical protein
MAFAKGKSGNPGGRPKSRMATQELILALSANSGERLRRIVNALLDRAETGDTQAISAVFDRIEGKPPQFSTGDSDEFRKAMDLSDDELAAIAAGSGDGAAETETGPPITH